MSLSQKDCQEETHWLSGKEKVPAIANNTEGHVKSSGTLKDPWLLIFLKKVQL